MRSLRPTEDAGRRSASRSAGLLCGCVAAGLAVGTAVVLAGFAPAPIYRDGPPPGFTGGFGEQSCNACHFEAELNDPDGTLRIRGIPERYEAGRTYPLTIRLEREGMVLAGFQLAARFKESGAQAGALQAAPEETSRVAISTDRGVTYAYQRYDGSEAGEDGSAEWVVLWTAPPAGGPVIFNVAANAADGDDSISGDFVYTTEMEVSAH